MAVDLVHVRAIDLMALAAKNVHSMPKGLLVEKRLFLIFVHYFLPSQRTPAFTMEYILGWTHTHSAMAVPTHWSLILLKTFFFFALL